MTNILCSFLLLLCLLCSAFAESHTSSSQQHTYTLQLSSLMPSSICTLSSKVAKHKSSLKVVHKHGPCSNLNLEQDGSADEILRQDESRVESILAATRSPEAETASTRLPAESGRALGTGNYFVSVGLGTPEKEVSLVFDTGSDLTWTQCQPCKGHCYTQKDPIFDPSASSSYANHSCSSQPCSTLKSSTSPSGVVCPTPTSTCIYHVRYGDGSITEGYLSTETLTLTSSDVIHNFLFGCGQNNDGLFTGIAGLLGLGRAPVSIVQQAADNYGRLFSYCLPASSSSTGHLTLGAAASVQYYTPMLTINPGKSFYALQISGISVGGRQLGSEAAATLQSTKTIIDSGTVITRLPAAAYAALREEFRKYMAKYPPAAAQGGSGLLDTCYDLSGVATGTFTIPKVSITFGGGATVELLPGNILYVINISRVCLAFAAGKDLALLGNVQQKGFDVVYDIPGARIGFTSGGC